ncbi:MAG: electron transfer flavoprotein alpha subunit [Clostridia bacterium]|nr:electron transfer flavoprotein alpha subunit [Clostridia bacterium]
MNKDIWVYIEHAEGKIANVSLELLGEAIRIKNNMQKPGQVVAVIIGSDVRGLAPKVLEYGAQEVYIAEDPRLKLYHPEYYGVILEQLINENDPHIFLMGATYLGSQLAPMVAAKVKTGVAAHCIELKLDDQDNLIAVVPAFGGKVLGDILCPKHRPQMATIKPGILNKPDKTEASGEIVDIDLNFLDKLKPVLKPLSLCREEPKGVPLEEAEIVVCGGWGVGDKEHWQLLEKIAERLGGAVACTRPPIDEGWAPGEHMMIGTSGKSVRPKIYLGFGISGATHHICGMKDAGLIISLNKDEQAEIFKVSDFGLVGDVKEVLPLLEEAFRLK